MNLKTNLILRSIFLLSFLALVSFSIVYSCESDRSEETYNDSKQKEINKNLALDFIKRAFSDRDPVAAGELVTDRYIQHNPNVPSTKKGMINGLTGYLSSHPGLTYRVHGAWVDGDYVFVHMQWKTGPEDIRGSAVIDIFRIQDGKLDEHWDVFQEIPENPISPMF